MQKNKIIIAKKTLSLLEKNSWDKIKFSNIINKKNNLPFHNKKDLLININRYFDFLLKQNLVSLEKSTSKDMLFEVIMARLDILNEHRKSIKNIIKYLKFKPQILITLLPSFLETIIQIATLCYIDINGIKGIINIKSIFILYLAIIYTWDKDEGNNLEKTMTTLDKYLTNLDKFRNFIK